MARVRSGRRLGCSLVRACAVLLLAAPPLVRAETWLVAPPSGGDDTAVLQAAFDACVPGGPSCTVRLAAGVYRTRQILASSFHGSIQGEGIAVTAVEPFGQLHVDKDAGPAGIYSAPPSMAHPYPFLVTLLGSDLTASDLSFRVPLPEPTDGWYYGCPDSSCYGTFLKTIISVDGSARFFRVEFAGVPAPANDLGVLFSVNNGPDINGSSWGAGTGGELVVQSSRFSNLDNGFEVGPVDGLAATIGGSPGAGNVFDQSFGGIFFTATNTAIDYSYNHVTGGGLASWVGNDGNRLSFAHNDVAVTLPGAAAINVDNFYRGAAPSTVLVEHNRIDVRSPGGSATYFNDPSVRFGGQSLSVVMASNDVQVSDPTGELGAAGIWLRYVANALVASNRVSGTGCEALYLGRVAFTTAQANDLNGFTSNNENCGVPGVPIFLGALAHDNLVIGGGLLRASVLDWGTNDTVVGARTIHGAPPGPALSDAMDVKQAARRQVR